MADPGYSVHILLIEVKTWQNGRRAIREELYRLVFHQSRRAHHNVQRGGRQRLNWPDLLSGGLEVVAAGRQNAQIAAAREQSSGKISAGRPDVLTVVQHQQDIEAAK